MNIESFTIGPLKYSALPDENLLEEIDRAVTERRTISICHPNAHFVVLSSSDVRLRDAVHRYTYVQPDGIGIHIARWILYPSFSKHRDVQTGTDFYHRLIVQADAKKNKIYLLGGTKESIQRIAEIIGSTYPNIEICGFHHGYFEITDESVVKDIIDANPDILFIGMGVPRQEFWLLHHRSKLPVPVILTVGAGIEFVSGVKRRAPKLIRSVGLEWLFRLTQEPGRLWRRYLIGIPHFLMILTKQKFLK